MITNLRNYLKKRLDLTLGASALIGLTSACNSVSSTDIPIKTELQASKWCYEDADIDGWGNPHTKTDCDVAPLDYVDQPGDCDDTDAAINPDAVELCDGVDNNCDDQIDEGLVTYYTHPDADLDGFANPDRPILDNCTNTYLNFIESLVGEPAPTSDCEGGDAMDLNSRIYPGAPEICDYYDNDCNGLVDDNVTGPYSFTAWADADMDFYKNPLRDDEAEGVCDGNTPIYLENFVSDADLRGDDCSGGATTDLNSKIYPGAPEICDGYDNNCNGETNEGCN